MAYCARDCQTSPTLLRLKNTDSVKWMFYSAPTQVILVIRRKNSNIHRADDMKVLKPVFGHAAMTGNMTADALTQSKRYVRYIKIERSVPSSMYLTQWSLAVYQLHVCIVIFDDLIWTLDITAITTL